MYNLIKNIILSKRYELSEMLKKIDMIWLQGTITTSQRQELIMLAQTNANIENSIDVMNKLTELDLKIKELEERLLIVESNGSINNDTNNSENNNENGNDDEITSYPEYIVGKWYYKGDKVSFDGKNYVCIAPTNAVCTWSPSEYPAYWSVIIEEVQEDINNEEFSDESTTGEQSSEE